MSDVKIEWPREIWMAEREDHDQGVVSAVLSEWATVARFDGDVEREKEFHRYVDGDIFDSQDKYWRARLEAVERERDAIGRDLNRAKYGEPDFAWSTHLAVLDETIARAERAEAALATARRDALEEAAKEAVDILETMQTCSIGTAQDRVSAAIRALANEAPE